MVPEVAGSSPVFHPRSRQSAASLFFYGMKKIDISQIQHEKMKGLITAYNLQHVVDLERIDVPQKAEQAEKFRNHFAVFSVDAPAAQVWDAYKSITPKDAWAGKLIDFVALYSPFDKDVYYPSSTEFPASAPGQRLFLQLNLAKGLVKVLVGHKVVRVDDNLMEVETNYLENSASRGYQIVRVVANGPDKSIIEHDTYYTSGSWFRDTVLYPPLHQLVIAQFHKNVANYISAQG